MDAAASTDRIQLRTCSGLSCMKVYTESIQISSIFERVSSLRKSSTKPSFDQRFGR